MQRPTLDVPACVKSLIKKFSQEEMTNPPRAVYRYSYKGNTVYFVPAICCDFYSDLFDDHCNLLGHPDGGIMGKGDGKVPDFFDKRTDPYLIWKDIRK
ncbi:MAG: hypothetical protein IT254_12850 [Chitinophagaceae bacterium]|nr:hypothetical protein [Bacteroidota bacterium]MCC6259206.1 hypothetical protein [Chitinophagaceae bacterium]MCW5916436.1 hypothetical protein [Ferruginibacter sp.]